MKQDLHTYRALRRIYLSQRRFYEITDRARSDGGRQHRIDRIKQMLGKRRKYAPALTNGRYDEYGCIRRGA